MVGAEFLVGMEFSDGHAAINAVLWAFAMSFRAGV
jgi:hypothetical protein